MERTLETPALVVRLLAWYVAMLLGLWILHLILTVLANIDISSGGLAATVLAAVIPGDIYFRRTSQLPSSGFGWRMAIGFSLSSICISALQIALLKSLGDAQALELVGNLQFLLLMLFLHVIMIGPLKWFFGWGALSRQRAVEKRAIKAPSAEQQKGGT